MFDEFDAYDFAEFTEQDFAAIDAALARTARGRPNLHVVVEKDSPFSKFLSWKNHLAVTDLVAPLWCEVQYEYGLYGERHKPSHLRPSTFTSKTGKQIRVHQQLAHAKDRRLKRGQSVHKALEDELHPEKIIVHPVSQEERFGFRLIQLIDGFNQLLSNGITRELPVFTITHSQVVLGIIDEVLCLPLTRPEHLSTTSPQKRRSESSPTRQTTPPSAELSNAVDGKESTKPEDLYELHIIDYKTRRSPTVPSDKDSLSPRLQLMMYHRMLSSLLKPEAFDFDLLWSRLKLNPIKPFSAQFLKDVLWEQRQIDPADCNVHLKHLVTEWISTVRRKSVGLAGISRQLQIIYRRSVYAGKRQDKGKDKATEVADTDDSIEALVLREELDLARAIEESLDEASQVAHHVNSEQAGSSAVQNDTVCPSDSGQPDSTLAWAIQQSLLTCVQDKRAQSISQQADAGATHDDRPLDEAEPAVTASKEQGQEESTLEISPIIGRKEFGMNDDELDTHIDDVLRWWFGARPARGVDVGQTNRCLTCEYLDSCEWRQEKAREKWQG